MENCALIDELNRLRKSSGDSIDSEKSFDEFKQYMHVARDIEKDLKNILRNVNRSHRKTLVLLCGSAGEMQIPVLIKELSAPQILKIA